MKLSQFIKRNSETKDELFLRIYANFVLGYVDEYKTSKMEVTLKRWDMDEFKAYLDFNFC